MPLQDLAVICRHLVGDRACNPDDSCQEQCGATGIVPGTYQVAWEEPSWCFMYLRGLPLIQDSEVPAHEELSRAASSGLAWGHPLPKEEGCLSELPVAVDNPAERFIGGPHH